MAQGQHLKLRLFLEGIEIPCISANVQVAANTPASCSIQVLATDKVMQLLPRTVVHLFFYDYVESGHVAIDQQPKSSKLPYEDWFNSKYKLLFMGELITLKFQKTHGSRAAILECSDFSNYWDTTFQYNFGGSLFGGRRQAAFIGANSTFFTSPLGHGTGTISRLLGGRSANYPELRGLLAGVVRMLEAIGGSYYGSNSFRGANDFTSIAELRLKVLQQITAAEADTSTAKLFARKAFNMWMNRATQSLGKLVSFRGLVKTCFKFIFHEVYPCPVARFLPDRMVKKKQVIKTGPKAAILNKTREVISLIEGADAVVKKHVLSKLYDQRAALAKGFPSRHRRLEKSLEELRAITGLVGGGNDNVPKHAMTAHSRILDVSRLVNNYRADVLDSSADQIRSKYDRADVALRKILGLRKTRSRLKDVQKQARVNNQIFRPDIWFSSPPRCNVLWPEQYDSFQFARQYLREVSRLELQTHNEILGNDALFNGRYYAPNVEDVRRGVKLSSRRFARLIMDHELFTGIIPMFENMSEANLAAMRGGKTTRQGAKLGYAQRAVNFQYFKYRFDARQMSASGRFNPHFVPGFPSLIVDRGMDQQDLEISSLPLSKQRQMHIGNTAQQANGSLGKTAKDVPSRAELLRKLVSNQYLGVCGSLAHSVNQTGGYSQYQFMHARVHREDTEFLGVDKVDRWKVVGRSAGKPTVVAAPAVSPPKKGSKGPHGGAITKVRDVSGAHTGRLIRLLDRKVKVIIGETYPNNYFRDAFASKKDFLEAGAYEVTETSIRRRKEKEDLPIEEAIKPPWIWDGWSVPKIGETYDQLFGTSDITDVSGYGLTQKNAGDKKLFAPADEIGAARKQAALTASNKKKKSNKSLQTGKVERADSKAKEQQYAASFLLKDKEKTIENSVDFLIRAYSFVKVNNLDVGDFLRAYGWRPVATMVDILGSSDLQIIKTTKSGTKIVKKKFVKKKARVVTFTDANGNTVSRERSKAVYGVRYVKEPFSRIGYTVTGKEGFHSRAFSDTEDLFGLVSPTVKRVLGLTGNKRKIAARLDVRKRRREVVRLYVAELTGSKGLMG